MHTDHLTRRNGTGPMLLTALSRAASYSSPRSFLTDIIWTVCKPYVAERSLIGYVDAQAVLAEAGWTVSEAWCLWFQRGYIGIFCDTDDSAYQLGRTMAMRSDDRHWVRKIAVNV